MGGSNTVKQFASFLVVVPMPVLAPAGVPSTIETFGQHQPSPWRVKPTLATRQVSVVNPSDGTLNSILRYLEISRSWQKIANAPAIKSVIHALKIAVSSHTALELGEK